MRPTAATLQLFDCNVTKKRIQRGACRPLWAIPRFFSKTIERGVVRGEGHDAVLNGSETKPKGMLRRQEAVCKKEISLYIMIDRETVDRIFAAADIVDIVGEFVTLKKKGVNYQACCPFHNEKTPSFVVSPSKGLYKCFGCGKGGNSVSFLMEHESLTYPEALKWIAKKYGIEVREKEESQEDKQRNNDRESMMVATSWASEYFREQLTGTAKGKDIGLAYFRERGFNDATIDKFGLGYCPDGGDEMTQAALKAGYKEEFLTATGLTIKRETGGYYDRFCGRVMFPIHSLAGRVIGFGGRTLRTGDKAKYLNSPESEIYHKSHTLYGIHLAKRAMTQLNNCILVEGYTDVMQMHQSGVENVVASSGTSLTVEQIKLIKRFTHNITAIFDGDTAGIKASLRGIDMILREGLNVRVVLLPDGQDPDSFARSHNATELRAFIEQHEEDFISFKIRLLFEEEKENDPIRRAALITDIVQSIAVIPDNIARSVFTQECARRLGIDEDMLIREVARTRAGQIDGRAGRDVIQNTIRKEQFLTGQAGASASPAYSGGISVAGSGEGSGTDSVSGVPGFSGNETAAGISPVDLVRRGSEADRGLAREVEVLERELVGYLLKYGDSEFDFFSSPTDHVSLGVAETIIGDLDGDSIELVNPLYRQIYAEYAALYKESGAPQASHFINHPSPEMCSLAVDLLTESDVHRPSQMWQRHGVSVSTERERLSDAIPKAITIYKSKVVSTMIAELQKELAGFEEITPRADEILKQLSALNDLRREVYNKYLRTI